LEDSPNDHELVATTIIDAEINAEFLVADSRNSFTSGIKKFNPQIILADYDLPELNGLEALEICKNLNLTAPFIFVTGAIGEDKAIECVKGGAFDYVLKHHLNKLPVAVTKAIEEITQRTIIGLQQQQLVQASKLAELGTMAAGIAHEINNPLSIVQMRAGQISLLSDKQELDREQIKDFSEKIHNAAKRIGKIVSGLNSFSRNSEYDKPVATNIVDLIEELLQICEAKLAHDGIDVSIPEKTEDKILCKPSQIQQVLLNMLNNSHDAIKEIEEKWIKISLQTNQQKGFADIIVKDSGAGIPIENIDRILQPFFTTKEPGKGTGLGLAISHSIMEQHDGQLFLDKEAPNTSFVLRFPLYQEEARSETA
jgi:C4-dicarboxylate-specific signal transduction histidine kinase